MRPSTVVRHSRESGNPSSSVYKARPNNVANFGVGTLVDVPTLEVVSLQDAQLELSLTGKRGVMMRQYMDYIGQLETGQAGKLIPDEGEITAAVRRRLGAAAQLLGKSLVVNRLGDVVFFWEEGSGSAPRRRGRRKKASAETE